MKETFLDQFWNIAAWLALSAVLLLVSLVLHFGSRRITSPPRPQHRYRVKLPFLIRHRLNVLAMNLR